MGHWSRSRWFFGTPNLPTQLASQSQLKRSFFHPSSYTFPQPESPWREAEMGWGPCCHPEFLRPWHKGLGSGPPSWWGRGEEWRTGHSMTFRGPQRRAPGPSLPRSAPPCAPWPWRGSFYPLSLLGPRRSGGHTENVGRRKPGGVLGMGEGLRGDSGGPLRELQLEAIQLGVWKLLSDLGPGGKAGGSGVQLGVCERQERSRL